MDINVVNCTEYHDDDELSDDEDGFPMPVEYLLEDC